MTTLVQGLAVIGFAVIALIAIGVAVTFLVLGTVVLERLTGIPADQRRGLLESRREHAARVAPVPSREDWLRVGELLAAEDARREQAAGNVVSLEGWRAAHHHIGGGAA